jgi:hypothetical protein
MDETEQRKDETRERELETRAYKHALCCLWCAGAVVRWRDRIHRPWSTVPPAVATEVRVGLCSEGRAIVDELLIGGA